MMEQAELAAAAAAAAAEAGGAHRAGFPGGGGGLTHRPPLVLESWGPLPCSAPSPAVCKI